MCLRVEGAVIYHLELPTAAWYPAYSGYTFVASFLPRWGGIFEVLKG